MTLICDYQRGVTSGFVVCVNPISDRQLQTARNFLFLRRRPGPAPCLVPPGGAAQVPASARCLLRVLLLVTFHLPGRPITDIRGGAVTRSLRLALVARSWFRAVWGWLFGQH